MGKKMIILGKVTQTQKDTQFMHVFSHGCSFELSDIFVSFGIPICQKVTKGSKGRGAFKGEEIEYSVIPG